MPISPFINEDFPTPCLPAKRIEIDSPLSSRFFIVEHAARSVMLSRLSIDVYLMFEELSKIPISDNGSDISEILSLYNDDRSDVYSSSAGTKITSSVPSLHTVSLAVAIVVLFKETVVDLARTKDS